MAVQSTRLRLLLPGPCPHACNSAPAPPPSQPDAFTGCRRRRPLAGYSNGVEVYNVKTLLSNTTSKQVFLGFVNVDSVNMVYGDQPYGGDYLHFVLDNMLITWPRPYPCACPGCDGTCSEAGGDFQCACVPGHVQSPDKHTCINTAPPIARSSFEHGYGTNGYSVVVRAPDNAKATVTYKSTAAKNTGTFGYAIDVTQAAGPTSPAAVQLQASELVRLVMRGAQQHHQPHSLPPPTWRHRSCGQACTRAHPCAVPRAHILLSADIRTMCAPQANHRAARVAVPACLPACIQHTAHNCTPPPLST